MPHCRSCRSTDANDVVAALLLRVERGEVLREPLAEPLLVVVAPADRLAPPLVRELVGEEELGKAAERRGIVAPDERRRRQRLVQRGEVAGTVAAGQVAFDQREREASGTATSPMSEW